MIRRHQAALNVICHCLVTGAYDWWQTLLSVGNLLQPIGRAAPKCSANAGWRCREHAGAATPARNVVMMAAQQTWLQAIGQVTGTPLYPYKRPYSTDLDIATTDMLAF